MLYSEEDKQGWAWRIMLFVRERFVLPVLVPREVDGVADEEKLETVMADALREADEADTLAKASSQRLVRSNSRSVAQQGALFDLFGSIDPTHVGSKRNVLQDIRQWRSGLFAPSVPDASLGRASSAGLTPDASSSDVSGGDALHEDELEEARTAVEG